MSRPMHGRLPIGFWTALQLAAAVLVVWGVALLVFVDVDKLAWRW
jgi:hypothetical protein